MLSLALVCTASLVAPPPVGGIVQTAALVAPDASSSDWFGSAVAIDGDTIVVGARLEDTGGDHAGAGYVYVRIGSEWSFQAQLLASDAAAGDAFGTAVALHGDTAVIGAPFRSDAGTYSGAAYVFVRSGTVWTETAKLVADVPAAGDRFGSALAVVEGWIAVGVPMADRLGTDSGTVLLFNGSASPSEFAELQPDSGGPGDQFGGALAMDAANGLQYLVVGAPYDDGVGADAGAAYAFRRQGYSWIQTARFEAFDGAAGDRFGVSVAVREGTTAAVGAPRHEGGASDAGAVYLFAAGGDVWDAGPRVEPSLAAADDHFGGSVALAEDTLLVGSRNADRAGPDSGAATLFRRVGARWAEIAEVIPNGAAADDGFGFPVAISGTAAVVGAYEADTPATDAGKAYVFEGLPSDPGVAHCFGDGSGSVCPCGNFGAAGQGCAHSGGFGATILGSGAPSVSADSLLLEAYGCPPGNSGLFFAGRTALDPGSPLYDGLQCAGGDARRFRGVFQTTGVAADEDFVAQDPSGVYFQPGATYTFQFWTRDVATGPSPCGTNANLSAAWSVVMEP